VATWYVDSNASGAQDGTSPTDAWQTLEFVFNASTAHSSASGDTGGPVSFGDEVIVRRTHNEVWDTPALISVRPTAISGTPNFANTLVIAADGHALVGQVGDWSGDSGSAVPVIDGNDTTSSNHYFHINSTSQFSGIIAGLRFQNFGSASGGPNDIWDISGSYNIISFRDCEFQDWNAYAITTVRHTRYLEFLDCAFDSGGSSVSVNGAIGLSGAITLKRTSITNCRRAVNMFTDPIIIFMEDCEFGGTASGGGDNLFGDFVGVGNDPRIIVGRNNDLKSAPHWDILDTEDHGHHTRVFLTDYDITENDASTPGDSSSAQLAAFEMTGQFRARRDTSTIDSANDATWSWRVEPNIQPLESSGDDAHASISSLWPAKIFNVSRYLEGGTAVTVTARLYFENWSNVPDETECYLVARYFNGTQANRDTTTSTEDPSSTGNDAWLDLTATFTPDDDGPVIFEVWLETEENDDEIVYVSPKLLVE